MENYEIRILRLDGSLSLLAERQYLNLDAAITAGKLLAKGRRFEVWTDDGRLYPAASQARIAGPPSHPAA